MYSMCMSHARDREASSWTEADVLPRREGCRAADPPGCAHPRSELALGLGCAAGFALPLRPRSAARPGCSLPPVSWRRRCFSPVQHDQPRTLPLEKSTESALVGDEQSVAKSELETVGFKNRVQAHTMRFTAEPYQRGTVDGIQTLLTMEWQRPLVMGARVGHGQ